MHRQLPAQERRAIYDALLEELHQQTVTERTKSAAAAFIADTPYEDEWLARERFIDGSHALLMRSMLREQGTLEERSLQGRFHEVRDALRALAEKGAPVPAYLVEAAKVNVKYYRNVVTFQANLDEVFR
jgi:hypothetical protein